MSLYQEDVKYRIAFVLAILLIMMAVYLWFIDLLSMQRVFGMLLASELIAFAMLVYVYSKPSFPRTSKAWLLSGSIVVAIFLLLALMMAAQ